MSTARYSRLIGGTAIVGVAAGLAAFAAKNAKESERQDEIVEHLVRLPGVEAAVVDVTIPALPWATAKVDGAVCLSSTGIDEFEERFDACVRAVRAVMDEHREYTAEIDLRAEPVEPLDLPADTETGVDAHAAAMSLTAGREGV